MRRTVGLRCTICNNPARPQIDLAIANGLSKRAMAERHATARQAIVNFYHDRSAPPKVIEYHAAAN